MTDDTAQNEGTTPAPETVSVEAHEALKTDFQVQAAKLAETTIALEEAKATEASYYLKICDLNAEIDKAAAAAQSQQRPQAVVFANADDEAAALKRDIVALFEQAKAKVARLADVVPQMQIKHAETFQRTIESLARLFKEMPF